MSPETPPEDKIDLSRRASIAADIAGYLLAAALIGVMFALSGAFF